jgi:hypothetical protein
MLPTEIKLAAYNNCHQNFATNLYLLFIKVCYFLLFFLALQPSAGYGLLWLCSPARFMASCGSAAQRGLWPPVALQPSACYGLPWLCSPAQVIASSFHEVSWSHTTTRHSRQHSSGRAISPSQRTLPNKTQHTQQTNIHAPCGIRTHDCSRRASVDLRLRPDGPWDRPFKYVSI